MPAGKANIADKGIFGGEARIISHPPSDEYRNAELWDNFGPEARRKRKEQEDDSQRTRSDPTD